MSSQSTQKPSLGVVVVTFNSADVIEACLASLVASRDVLSRVIVIDNSSHDGSCARVRGFIEDNGADDWIELIEEPVNGGYARGVNRGLRRLLEDRSLDLFWVLNPDCRFAPATPRRFCEAAEDGPFALMGGRTIFDAHPDIVQTDGGRVSRLTGQCHSVNAGVPLPGARLPGGDDIDFIAGSSCVASRAFLEGAGLMREDYFLFYEEVDWAFRRGTLPLRVVADAEVHHIGGTAIGSGSLVRRASPFANYFNYRGRMLFLRRFMPLRMAPGIAHGLAKAGQLTLRGHRREAWAIIAAVLGLAPPREVRERLRPETLALIRHDAVSKNAGATVGPGSRETA